MKKIITLLTVIGISLAVISPANAWYRGGWGGYYGGYGYGWGGAAAGLAIGALAGAAIAALTFPTPISKTLVYLNSDGASALRPIKTISCI